MAFIKHHALLLPPWVPGCDGLENMNMDLQRGNFFWCEPNRLNFFRRIPQAFHGMIFLKT
jgi:hypothetical protein